MMNELEFANIVLAIIGLSPVVFMTWLVRRHRPGDKCLTARPWLVWLGRIISLCELAFCVLYCAGFMLFLDYSGMGRFGSPGYWCFFPLLVAFFATLHYLSRGAWCLSWSYWVCVLILSGFWFVLPLTLCSESKALCYSSDRFRPGMSRTEITGIVQAEFARHPDLRKPETERDKNGCDTFAVPYGLGDEMILTVCYTNEKFDHAWMQGT